MYVLSERSSKFLMFAVISFVFIGTGLFHLSNDAELWFDPAFSLETAHQLNEGRDIDWASYDVHPGTYYVFLSNWMRFQPEGFEEDTWARLLSLIAGLFVLSGTFIFLTNVFGFNQGALGTMVVGVVSTTAQFFALEPRSYIFLLAVVAWSLACSSIIANNVNDKGYLSKLKVVVSWLVIVGSVWLLPNLHYFGFLAVPFILLISYILIKERVGTKNWLRAFIPVLIVAIVAVSFVFFNIALPQRERSEGSWYQPPDITSFPSAMFYSAFIADDMVVESQFFEVALYYLFVGLAIFCAYRLFKMLREDPSVQTKVIAVMFATLVLPLLALVGLSACSSGGFCNLYHHRLFLVVTWLFPISCVLILFKNVQLKRAMVILLMIGFIMNLVFAAGAHHELDRTIAATPCEPILIGHESPFSMLPYKSEQRDNGCPWKHFVSTGISERRARTSGFDAVPSEEVYWNWTLPKSSFYYVESSSQSLYENEGMENRSRTLLYLDDGVGLVLIGAEE